MYVCKVALSTFNSMFDTLDCQHNTGHHTWWRWLDVYVCVCVHACMCVRACACVCVHVCICKYACTHVQYGELVPFMHMHM